MSTAMISTTPDAPQGVRPVDVGRWLWRVAVYVVLAVAVVVLLVAVLIPRMMGATVYTVMTGSMRPTMPPGTLVVVKPTEFGDIRIGDVVTFQIRSGEPLVATHRVVGVGTTWEGERSLRTQGDANEVADSEAVREVQVKGTVSYAVPRLGHASTWLTGDQRSSIVTLVAVGLAGYAAIMFGSAVRERRKDRA